MQTVDWGKQHLKNFPSMSSTIESISKHSRIVDKVIAVTDRKPSLKVAPTAAATSLPVHSVVTSVQLYIAVLQLSIVMFRCIAFIE